MAIPPDNDAAASSQGIEEIGLLLGVSARILCKSSDAKAFLDWIADAGPHLAPNFTAMIDPRTGPVGLAFRAMGVPIFNAMPLPDAAFRPRPLPKPGRNDPCSCGSGNKYKQCCQPLGEMLDMSRFNLLQFVLEALPKKRYAELPDSKVDVHAVAHTAMEWNDAGRPQDAVALLEPWFAAGRKLHAKHELLFDQLMESYLRLGRERKREALLERMMASGEKVLRAAALQRRATMLSDKGKFDESWAVFLEAQREDPDNPGISLLEVTLLMGRGETQQARERARFWAGRMERARDPELQPAIQFMRQIIADPAATFAGISRERNPELDRLMHLFEAAPAPQAHYSAEIDDGAAMLICDEAMAAVESAWRSIYPQEKPHLTMTQLRSDHMWDDARDWLDFLERTPLAWHSFDVLDDLVMAAEVVAELGLDAALLDPLLARGSAVLEVNLAAIKLDGKLPWAIAQNRPPLRMLAHQAFRILNEARHNEAARARFVQCAQRVMTLNPNDNHGLRGPLSRLYIEAGEPQRALLICDAYPDDSLCELPLNRVLALHDLGRRGEALTALGEIAHERGTVIKMLLAANPKAPRPSPHGIAVGGREEAWDYREDHYDAWVRNGALDWLREAWRAVRK